MTLFSSHLECCRQNFHVLVTTVGVSFYGTLTLAVLAYSALLFLWP